MKIENLKRVTELNEEREKIKAIIDSGLVFVAASLTLTPPNYVQFRSVKAPEDATHEKRHEIAADNQRYDALTLVLHDILQGVEDELKALGVDCHEGA